MTGDALILYHHNSSVCAAKIRVALAEKKLPFESRLMRLDGDQFDPDYLVLNPNAVVPTLVHKGRAVIESNVILEYLEDAFPEQTLRPADPFDRSQARLLMMRLDGDSGIHHAASVATYAIAYRHRLIAMAGGGEGPALRAVIEANMNPKSRAWLEAVVFGGIRASDFADALLRIDRLLAEFEGYLTASRWLAGETYSIADAAFTPYMIRFDLLQMTCLWQDRPAVTDWYARLTDRPSASAVFDWYDPTNTETLRRRGRKSAVGVASLLKEVRTR